MEKCLNLLNRHLTQTRINLSLPVSKIIKMCRFITNQYYFAFNYNFYKRKFGLQIGEPVISLIAFIFLEVLESGTFQNILAKQST